MKKPKYPTKKTQKRGWNRAWRGVWKKVHLLINAWFDSCEWRMWSPPEEKSPTIQLPACELKEVNHET